jgi:hypothetical protein
VVWDSVFDTIVSRVNKGEIKEMGEAIHVPDLTKYQAFVALGDAACKTEAAPPEKCRSPLLISLL